eukprot:6962642-Prymnesium_polylepis.1
MSELGGLEHGGGVHSAQHAGLGRAWPVLDRRLVVVRHDHDGALKAFLERVEAIEDAGCGMDTWILSDTRQKA